MDRFEREQNQHTATILDAAADYMSQHPDASLSASMWHVALTDGVTGAGAIGNALDLNAAEHAVARERTAFDRMPRTELVASVRALASRLRDAR